VLDPQVTISGPEAGDKTGPDVGGDPSGLAPTYFCVVYERVEAGGDTDVHARLASRFDGSPVGSTILLANGTVNTQNPAISNTNGALDFTEQEWIVAWEQEFTPGDIDILGARIAWDGTVNANNLGFATSPMDEFDPCPGPKLYRPGAVNFLYLVAYEGRDAAGFTALVGRTWSSGGLQTVADLRTYGLQTSIGSLTADTDGANWVIGVGRTFGTFPNYTYSVEVNCVHDTSGIGLTESVFVSTPSGDEQRPRVWSKYSSTTNSPRVGVALERVDGGEEDIWNAVYEIPVGGPIVSYCEGTSALCPCGNGGAAGHGCAHSTNPAGGLLAATGDASLSADSVVLTATSLPPTATCLFFQGSLGTNPPQAFGDGLRCTGVGVIRIGTKTASGGATSYPQAGDLPVSVKGSVPAMGATRFYQVWFRNAAAFCTASTFNLTQGLRVEWVQ